MMLRTIEWRPDGDASPVPGRVRFIDQTRLPLEVHWIETASVDEVAHAIRTLQVRGAPAIGIAAAMGVVAAAQAAPADRPIPQAVDAAAALLGATRPTAVNLFWALERMRRTAHAHAHLGRTALLECLAREAVRIRDEDAAMCRAIGAHGATLLHDGDVILTHCNAGGLATAEFGTALAPVYAAATQGKRIRVFADETRPLLQGSRLTAWELRENGIDVTVICDNAAAWTMKRKQVCAVLVGADRIAANGDAANKVGTYGVAVLARHHGIPFYVLAPTSTFDRALPDGDGIPIEERSAQEVTHGFGRQTAPDGVAVFSPAFDVTPAELITAIVCEKGILRPDYRSAIRDALRDAVPA